MKYIYFIWALTYFYVSADDQLVLQVGAQAKCQCNDILDKILNALDNGSKQIDAVRNEIKKVRTNLQDLEKDLDANSQTLAQTESEINAAESSVNSNLKTVNLQTFTLNDIDARVVDLAREEEALDCVIDDNGSSLNDILEILKDLETCSCTPKTTTPRPTRPTTASYHQ